MYLYKKLTLQQLGMMNYEFQFRHYKNKKDVSAIQHNKTAD